MCDQSKKKQGAWIAILGPDGSGKSSVIDEVKFDLNHNEFSGIEVIHLRPKLGLQYKDGENSYIAEDPHGEKSRNTVSSLVKIIYFLFDYTIGYLIKVMPHLRSGKLVIFDRYYHDLLVDPKRYRYGAPMWFARYIGYLIPKPDLVIILSASAAVIQSRKQEVSFDETRRQTEAYIGLAKNMKNSIIIDVNKPLKEVVEDVSKAIKNCGRL
jgi:thymidylate kinase